MIQGVIARRMLLNFRADAEVVQRLLPAPLQVDQQNGHAIVGVCLIRLENLRPHGVPGPLGLSSENMAHRVAIRYPGSEGIRPGVFVWRRETDQRLVELLGGRLFPSASPCSVSGERKQEPSFHGRDQRRGQSRCAFFRPRLR